MPTYSDGRLEVRAADYVVSADGEIVAMTPGELALLVVLIRHQGAVLTREQLSLDVWGPDGLDASGNSINMLVNRTRAKLRRALPGVEYIHTHPGLGYRFGPGKDG